MDEMPEECARDLVDLARAGMPNEVCGFLLTEWRIEPVRNISASPHRSFAFDPDTLLDYLLTRNEDILGIWHTHPSGRNFPSDADCSVMTLYPHFRHWIGTVMDVYEWRMTDGGPRPVRRNGSTGTEGMAYPVLTAPAAVRRAGGRLTA